MQALAAAYRMPEAEAEKSAKEEPFKEMAYSMAYGTLHELLMKLKYNPVLPYLELEKPDSESCSHHSDLTFLLKLFEDAHKHPQHLKVMDGH